MRNPHVRLSFHGRHLRHVQFRPRGLETWAHYRFELPRGNLGPRTSSPPIRSCWKRTTPSSTCQKMTTDFAVRRPLKTSTFSSGKTPLLRTNLTLMKSKTPPRRHPNMANSPARPSQVRKSISATERGDASVATTVQRIGRTWNFTVNITDVLDETTSPSRAMKSTWERLLVGKRFATHQTALSRTWQGSRGKTYSIHSCPERFLRLTSHDFFLIGLA